MRCSKQLQKNAMLKTVMCLCYEQKMDRCRNDDVDDKILLVQKITKENAFLRILKKTKNAKCSAIRRKHTSTIALAMCVKINM